MGGSASRKSQRRRGRRSSRSFIGRLVYGTMIVGLWGIIGLTGLLAYHASQLPPIHELSIPKRPPNIAIVAEDGTLIANRGDTGGQAVAIKELPSYLPRAFVAIEDRRFYSHYGIDPLGITRALYRNITSRGVSQGGSTLTQQLAKNLFLTQDRTFSRKIQEAILSVWLERNYSKDQILELYLNRVYFGSGAYGVEAAAQRYFSKSAKAVSLAEAAMLAGLVQAPSRLAPNRNPEAAQARARLVLSAMADEGFIKDAMAKQALANPAEAVSAYGASTANYAADYVMDILDDFVGSVDKDIVVTTTLDGKAQGLAERAIVEELNAKGTRFGVEQGALVALGPDGAIRALVGGRNYSASQFNRAAAAKRQPGSAFKPFVYLAALERGLTPDDVREDSPVSIRGWTPENFSRDYRGPVTLTTALSLSLNTVAVKLGQEVGARTVVRTAQRLGIASPLQANASIALGTSEVTPLELTAAYTAFANGGTGVIPYIIKSAKATDGQLVYQRAPNSVTLGRIIDPGIAAQMNAMMRETLLTGTARKAELPGWDAAGKTGTSQDFRDAWFVGYTASLVTGVWLGNDDGSPTKRVSGGNLPVEIWSRFMRGALEGKPHLPLPGGVRIKPADPDAPVVSSIPAPPSGRPPGGVPTRSSDNAWVPPAPQEKGLLQRLFGG